jgi:hypothetical protein
VSCPSAAPVDCTGSLVLRTASRVRLAGVSAVVELGSRRYDLAPGASRTLRVRLANGTRRLARRNGRLAVRAVASTGGADRIAESTRRLTVVLGTKAR